jgi:hypothetical protein
MARRLPADDATEIGALYPGIDRYSSRHPHHDSGPAVRNDGGHGARRAEPRQSVSRRRRS